MLEMTLSAGTSTVSPPWRMTMLATRPPLMLSWLASLPSSSRPPRASTASA